MKASSAGKVMLVIIILIAIGGAIWWWQSGNLDRTIDEAKSDAAKVSMEVVSMSITDIESGTIHVANKVVLKNPMPVVLEASQLDYTVLINGEKVAEGSYTKPIRLSASGSDTLNLPMEVEVAPMDRAIEKMDSAGKDVATYTFMNTIHTDIPIAGKRQIKFTINEELPIVRLPELKVGKTKVHDVGLKNSGLNITMHISNPNAFAIRMKDGHYTMTIDGESTMEGTLQEVVTLPAKETTAVEMNMDIKTGKAMKMGWKMLFDKKDTRYELTFDSKILSDKQLLNNSNMHFDEEGNLHDLLETMKSGSVESQ